MHNTDVLEDMIQAALAEDIGDGDLTTAAILNEKNTGHARIVAKQSGVLAGIAYAEKTFALLDPDIRFNTQFKDGSELTSDDIVLEIMGRISSILKGERTALNLLAHLSGISTLTAKYVEQVKGTNAKVTDTRKTTPMLRQFEKEAVRLGGGVNHRMGLYDMVLLKENHIEAAQGITNAVEKCRLYIDTNQMDIKIEVETTNLDQVREALECNVDQIMLDNMELKEMLECVKLIAGRAIVEASGGVSLKNVKSIAETGVDLISVGALTHSAPAFDFSLLVEGG